MTTAAWNLEAEQAVLGTLLHYYTPTLLDKLTGLGLCFEAFYWHKYGVVYRAILKIHADHSHVDAITVWDLISRYERKGWPSRADLDVLLLHADPTGVEAHTGVVVRNYQWRVRWAGVQDAADACERRSEEAFWAALSMLKAPVAEKPALRVVDGKAA